ncbi:MAG: SRPBCC family protein [Paracoccaceae bacterium]
MHLEHRRSIATPQAFAFDATSDFTRFEREGAGGATFTRTNGTGHELGSEWRVEAEFRGRTRRFNIRLATYTPHERLELATGSSKFDVRVTYAFTATGPAQCEMVMSIDTAARSLAGRLIFQTLQLARARFERYLAEAVDRMATQMEAEYKP